MCRTSWSDLSNNTQYSYARLHSFVYSNDACTDEARRHRSRFRSASSVWFLCHCFCCQWSSQLLSGKDFTANYIEMCTLIQILYLFTIIALCRTHIILANLRAPGTTTGYSIPRGFLFDYITCPNYTVEILGWVCFTIATSCLPALFFTLAGGLQMLQWAIAKHKRLIRVCSWSSVRAKGLVGILWSYYTVELMTSKIT